MVKSSSQHIHQVLFLMILSRLFDFIKKGTSTKIVSGTNLSLGEQLEKHLLLHFPFIKEAFFARCAIFVEGILNMEVFPCLPKNVT